MRYRILSALLGLALCGSGVAVAQSGSFLEPFTGTPTAPLPYPTMAPLSAWDVTVQSRDTSTFYNLEPMLADHGPDCSAPPAQHQLTGAYADAVFQCSNHIMTAMTAIGYGAIYLTPPAMLDWSSDTATLSFDLSTLRTSLRDWVDIWITPYDQHLQLVGDVGPVDLDGSPQTAVHIRMENASGTVFRANTVTNFVSNPAFTGGNVYTGWENFLTPSAAIRSPFQLTLSRTHAKFGIPSLNLWWIDQDMPDIGFTQGVVQFGHHSYNPEKDCAAPPAPCRPDTWHWDNIALNPSVPFTITRAAQRFVDPTTPPAFTFPSPSPAGAMLQFAALSDPAGLQISTNGGATWQPAQAQPRDPAATDLGKFHSYWTPIPAGISSVQVRGQGGWWGANTWLVRDASIWSQVGVPRTRTPTPAVPTATVVPPTATRVPPTATPLPPPATLTPVPSVVPSTTPVPGVQCAQVAIVQGGLTFNPQPASVCAE